MVPNARAKVCPDPVRSLGQPRPVTITAPRGLPRAIQRRGQQVRVAHIADRWRIDAEWWRDLISRRYFQLILADGSMMTVYRDLETGAWYAQAY